jgi:probable phosphoglycerate mutase
VARARRTVYVVRHGVTPWNEQGRICGHEDLSLSDLGREQARGAGRLLAPCRLDLALTSPLARTRETAELALEGRGVEVRTEPRLIELALAGWEGKGRAELLADPTWHVWLRAPEAIATPEGERLEDVRQRAAAAIADGLREVPPGGGLAVFTHGGVARVLVLHLLGLPLSGYHRLRCDCASVSAIEVTARGGLARVLALNLTDPLVALSGTPVG